MRTIETLIQANQAPMIEERQRRRLAWWLVAAIAITANLAAAAIIAIAGPGALEPRLALPFVGLVAAANAACIVGIIRLRAASRR